MDFVKMRPTEIIRHTDFFKGVSERSRKLVSDILLPKSLKKRQTLFSEGEKGHSVFICGSGSIQLSKINDEGRETVIKIIEPGEMFAEVILFENDRYPVTAVALSRSLVYLLPKHPFLCLLENGEFRQDFVGSLMKKMRFLAQQIVNLTTLTVEERFLRFVISHYGVKSEYKLSLSKKDMASAIGTNPETLSRAFASLKAKGLISLKGKTLTLHEIKE